MKLKVGDFFLREDRFCLILAEPYIDTKTLRIRHRGTHTYYYKEKRLWTYSIRFFDLRMHYISYMSVYKAYFKEAHRIDPKDLPLYMGLDPIVDVAITQALKGDTQ